MSVESKPNKLVKGLVLDTFHTDVDNTVATYALNSQLEDQEGNHFHYGSEVGTTYIKEIPTNHVVIGHINMERNETVLFTTDGTNSTIGILSRKDDMSYEYEIKVDDTKQEKKLNFKKDTYIRGVYRLLNGCDKVIYFVDGINKDRRININQLDSYKLPDTQSVASGIIFDDSLRATIYALSSATGNIQLIRLMSANAEATANVLATLTSGAELTKLLTASANGIGTAFANLMRTAKLVSSTNATGTTTSNVDIIRLLQGNISSIGSVNAILEVRTVGLVEIDVTLTGVASSTAALLRAALLESSLTTEASTVVDAILTRVINAQSQATANTSATAQITVPINATATATATTAAEAILSYAVNATANAMAETSATAQLSQVINASLNATATSSLEALIGLVLISTTTASGSVSTANLFINRLLTSSVTAQGTTTAEALIAKLLQSSVTAQATTTSNAVVSKLASSSVTAQASVTANSLVSKLLASTVNGIGSVTANLQIADLLSSTITGTATTQALLEAIAAIVSDPYIDNVSLLLQGDNNPTGVTQNNTFIDSSTNNFTITRNGNVTQGTFSPFDKSITNSGGSAYFDGAGDYLQIPNNSNLTLGTGDFTIEFWIYPLSQPGNFNSIIGGNATNEPIVNLRGSVTSIGISMNVFGSADIFNINFTFTQNNWYHVAISRSGTSLKVYVNGNQIGSTITDSTNISAPITSVGGLFNQYVQNFNGYISNLRVVKGTAVYTSNFQPSTTPLTAITNTSLLLNFTNAAIFDGVKNNNVETIGNASINTSVVKYGSGSLVFNGSTSYLNVGNQSTLDLLSTDFTVEFWLYKNATAAYMTVCGDLFLGSTNTWQILFDVNGTKIAWYNGANNTFTLTSTNTVSNSEWTHIAFVRLGTTLTVYLNGVPNGSATLSTNYSSTTNLFIGHTPELLAGRYLNGYLDDFRITKGIARYTSNFTVPSKLPSLIPNYLINRSLRFSSSRQTYLSRTPTVAGNRKTWTWSGWVKLGSFSGNRTLFSSSNEPTTQFYLMLSNDSLNCLDYINSTQMNVGTTQVFRDSSAWYHIICSMDTTQATSSNRVKFYINGQQVTNFSTTSYPVQDYLGTINTTVSHSIGREEYSNNQWFDGYMAEVNFIDGQALTPTSFGELSTTTGTWIPKLYTGTYGTNGFRLKFSDLTQLGEDFSGNLNNWTPNNFTTTPGANYDLINDTPINADDTIGNYATLNPLDIGNSQAVLSNGNIDINWSLTSGHSRKSTISMINNKWYCEIVVGSSLISVGLIRSNISNLITWPGSATYGDSGSYGYNNTGNKRTNGSDVVYGNTFTLGDIIGIAFDADNGKLWFSKNGTWQASGNPVSGINAAFTSITGEYNFVIGYYGFPTGGQNVSINFGQRPFAYTPPTGFKALNTSNLPTPTIGATAATQANKFMDISLYTGTGAAQSIFNSGKFQPDLVWIKNRTGTATDHALYDSVRGVTKQLSSSTTTAETTEATGLTAFNSNGFTIGALGQINTSGSNYIAWQWRASNTTVANTAGTIASTVSVNTTAGFSIVRYTGNGAASSLGPTIGHGLAITPSLIIIKNISNGTYNWNVWHSYFSSGQVIYFNLTNQLNSDLNVWGNTLPTSTVFKVGNAEVNGNGNSHIAYVWAEIDGFSKFNSYVGNGSTDGTFVYTGFRPKFILIKGTGAGTNWMMYNSIVDTSNPVNDELLANSSNNENSIASNNDIDFLSNGFKLRGTDASINTSAVTYIYGAFAEFPLKYANAALTERVGETVTVNYLVVGGGGGGGFAGGGGGAGQLMTGTSKTLPNSFVITVGTGGNAGNSTQATSQGINGENSILHDITSNGGGGGGGYFSFANGKNGGSGGGSGHATSGTPTAGTGLSGGNSGGGSKTTSPYSTGGGGGSGSAGVTGNGTNSGNGGNGTSSSITGSAVIYAAGGGGGGYSLVLAGVGGSSSVGGDGGRDTPFSDATQGTDFTGSGGGGSDFGATTTTPKRGGHGVVIITYSDSLADLTTIPGTLTYTKSVVGGLKVYRFTAGTGTITR